MFENDKRHGKGKYTFRRGEVEAIKGMYDNNVLKHYEVLKRRSSTLGQHGQNKNKKPNDSDSSESDKFGPKTYFSCKDGQADGT